MGANVYVVMGVSGCGKTTVGQLLAEKIGVQFFDSDDYHPPANIHKMKSGIPLDDNDRKPWLNDLSEKIFSWSRNGGAVLACSALKQSYREILSARAGQSVLFIYLRGDRKLIEQRMKERKHHYMPVKLLESQLATLEEPVDAITVQIGVTPEKICNEILAQLQGRETQ